MVDYDECAFDFEAQALPGGGGRPRKLLCDADLELARANKTGNWETFCRMISDCDNPTPADQKLAELAHKDFRAWVRLDAQAKKDKQEFHEISYGAQYVGTGTKTVETGWLDQVQDLDKNREDHETGANGGTSMVGMASCHIYSDSRGGASHKFNLMPGSRSINSGMGNNHDFACAHWAGAYRCTLAYLVSLKHDPSFALCGPPGHKMTPLLYHQMGKQFHAPVRKQSTSLLRAADDLERASLITMEGVW